MDMGINLIVEDYIKNLLIKKLKLYNVKHSLEFTITIKVFQEWVWFKMGMYAGYLYKIIVTKINKKTFYYKLKQLEKKGVFILDKKDGMLFIEPAPHHKKSLINLIIKLQKSNEEFKKFLEEIKKDKASNIKKIAVDIFKDVIDLKPHQINQITELFNIYIEITNKLFLFFKKIGVDFEDVDFKDCEDVFDVVEKNKDKVLCVNYKTRFDKLYYYCKKLENLIKTATEYYKYAFFVTLTFKRDKKLLEINKLIRKNWDRLRAFFRRKMGGDIKFIKIHEFHINGYPHLHILIFSNKKWLLHQKELSNIWEKYGMGKIVYIYLLKKDRDSYVWYRNRPKDCKEKNITSYLTKYFKKVFNDENNWQLALFWLTGLRFFTYSYKLNKNKTIRKGKKWEFIGVFNIEDCNINGLIALWVAYEIKEKFNKYKRIDLILDRLDKKRLFIKYKYGKKEIYDKWVYAKDWITPLPYVIKLWI